MIYNLSYLAITALQAGHLCLTSIKREIQKGIKQHPHTPPKKAIVAQLSHVRQPLTGSTFVVTILKQYGQFTMIGSERGIVARITFVFAGTLGADTITNDAGTELGI